MKQILNTVDKTTNNWLDALSMSEGYYKVNFNPCFDVEYQMHPSRFYYASNTVELDEVCTDRNTTQRIHVNAQTGK